MSSHLVVCYNLGMMDQRDYISINKKAYDDLAEEFERKIQVRKTNQKNIVNKFNKFILKHRLPNKSLLEIGPAAGYTTKLLCDSGYRVTAIELSPKLSEICKRIAPESEIINDDFLNHDFGDKKYSGVLVIAFIHLFPKSDTEKVLKKINSLLISDGIVYISTTLHKLAKEGFERNHTIILLRLYFFNILFPFFFKTRIF